MESQIFDLSMIWAMIIAFAVIMYVLMDGFDLGVGMLFPFAPDEDARDVMMNSVAPVWDGNETWLVLGGAENLTLSVELGLCRRLLSGCFCPGRGGWLLYSGV